MAINSHKKISQSKLSSSWEKISSWYEHITENGGHYYHAHVIMPNLQKLLRFTPYDSILDLGCGTGVLSHHIPRSVRYTGVDIAKSFIDNAKKTNKNPNHTYIFSDATKPLQLSNDFTYAFFILSLQNIKNQYEAIKETSKHLEKNGMLCIVLNHPCFRIPRQTSWEIDQKNNIEYRRVNRYLSPLPIPITMHPGKPNAEITWSYHYPISFYTKTLHDLGFCIKTMEEWTSDKESVGTAAKMENRARQEFPLFLTIVAQKI